ncbi:MAG: hypothetical protein GW788_01270 [Ignavibacteria bacterium]|nr:hypothetical protein [Ignavibacteria bacterium]
MRILKSAFTFGICLLTGAISLSAQPKVIGDIRLLVAPESIAYMRAQWSPSANHLLFTSLNHKGIYTYSFSTKTVEQLSNDLSVGFGANWIDDSSILVRHTKMEGVFNKNAVAIIQTDGNMDLKTPYINSMPSVPMLSLSKQTIYYSDKQELKVTESGFSRKSNGPDKPGFMAIGNKLYQIGSTTSKTPTILSGDEYEGDILNLTVSSDGNRLAFEVLGGSLFVIDLPSGNKYDLGAFNRPSFSPDGNYLAVMKASDNGYQITESEVFALKFDGSESFELTKSFSSVAMNPSWSPKGDQIAFDSPETGAIYLIPIQN